MNREQLREYVKQLPQEEVLRELLISQVDCNTKLEEVRAIMAGYQASKKSSAMFTGVAAIILFIFLLVMFLIQSL